MKVQCILQNKLRQREPLQPPYPRAREVQTEREEGEREGLPGLEYLTRRRVPRRGHIYACREIKWIDNYLAALSCGEPIPPRILDPS